MDKSARYCLFVEEVNRGFELKISILLFTSGACHILEWTIHARDFYQEQLVFKQDPLTRIGYEMLRHLLGAINERKTK